MTNSQRYEKYKKEHCKNCKNRKSDLCDIRISVIDNVIQTKCSYYERKNHAVVKTMQLVKWPNAKKKKPIMKGIDK